MRLAQSVCGTSKLIMILVLLIFFFLGAVLSYIWTMGFYATQEYRLPSQTSLTIENLHFPLEDATFFNVTVLNPSYSPSEAKIERIKVYTIDGEVHVVTSASPNLPLTLAPGESQIIKVFWDWSNYAGQIVEVSVIIDKGSGPVAQVGTPQMTLNVFDILFFNTTATSFYFNVTVQNAAVSAADVDIDLVSVYVEDQNINIPDVVPPLPQALEPNSTVLLTCPWNWNDYQGKNVTITVYTTQGFKASSTEKTVPSIP